MGVCQTGHDEGALARYAYIDNLSWGDLANRSKKSSQCWKQNLYRYEHNIEDLNINQALILFRLYFEWLIKKEIKITKGIAWLYLKGGSLSCTTSALLTLILSYFPSSIRAILLVWFILTSLITCITQGINKIRISHKLS